MLLAALQSVSLVDEGEYPLPLRSEVAMVQRTLELLRVLLSRHEAAFTMAGLPAEANAASNSPSVSAPRRSGATARPLGSMGGGSMGGGVSSSILAKAYERAVKMGTVEAELRSRRATRARLLPAPRSPVKVVVKQTGGTSGSGGGAGGSDGAGGGELDQSELLAARRVNRFAISPPFCLLACKPAACCIPAAEGRWGGGRGGKVTAAQIHSQVRLLSIAEAQLSLSNVCRHCCLPGAPGACCCR